VKNNSTTRFTDRVENYIKYRPGYPEDIIPFLKKEAGFNSSMQVADIGSGTGILSRLFLMNKNIVYAIEPNTAMRQAAESMLNSYTNFISIAGTAEETGLPEDSIDLIAAGQAFHWFEPVKTKAEFQRIAKRNCHAVLIWNERQVKSAFEQEYEKFLLKYATDYAKVNHKNITDEKIASFFAPFTFKYRSFYNEQIFDFEGLKGRLLSSSYVPNEGHPAYHKMITDLNRLYEKYQVSERIKIAYETKVYAGKIK
jgi:ubiquinone/menaquinone biosynthesis C-methylase UbiE